MPDNASLDAQLRTDIRRAIWKRRIRIAAIGIHKGAIIVGYITLFCRVNEALHWIAHMLFTAFQTCVFFP